MSIHPMILSPRRVLAGAALLLSSGVLLPSTVEAQTVGRREMRDARAAVQEGRLADGLERYERILKSAASVEQRLESLHTTVLILLSSGTDAAASELVRQRLDVLGVLVESGRHGNKLEVQALAALVGTIDDLEATVQESERKLISDSAAAELEREEMRLDAAEVLAAQEALVGAEREERLVLEQRLGLVERHLATREEELRAKVAEIGRCTEEMQLVLDQLEGTQASEVQMLQVVMRKNEDLAKNRLALQRQKNELAEQAKQLELKEEEVRRREEAIREVTERVLGKDQDDS